MRGPDPSRRLVRALERAGKTAGVEIAWELAASVPWASALFVGERHVLMGRAIPGPARDAFLAALPEMDISLPGACVADLVVDREGDATLIVRAFVIES